MKTEITIDGITYKVGDVLEQYNYRIEHRITAIGELGIVAIAMKNIDSYSSPEIYMNAKTLKNWKIKKPKKKVVVDQWINIYRDGDTARHETKKDADFHAASDRIACEHFYKEYEIDE